MISQAGLFNLKIKKRVIKIKRSGKYYRKNESEVMKKYGLKPTINSGSGWVQKEDGENADIICQLKSTDKDNINISLLDLHKVIYHADVSHKIPLFIIQFIQQNEEYCVMRLEDAESVHRALQSAGVYNYTMAQNNAHSERTEPFTGVSGNEQKAVIKSSPQSRKEYYESRSELWKKK